MTFDVKILVIMTATKIQTFSSRRRKLGVGLLVVMNWLEICMSIYSSSSHRYLHHP